MAKTGQPAMSDAILPTAYIVKDEYPNTSAQDTQWLAFNIQRPVFNDRQVWEAITLAFDFE